MIPYIHYSKLLALGCRRGHSTKDPLVGRPCEKCWRLFDVKALWARPDGTATKASRLVSSRKSQPIVFAAVSGFSILYQGLLLNKLSLDSNTLQPSNGRAAAAHGILKSARIGELLHPGWNSTFDRVHEPCAIHETSTCPKFLRHDLLA